MCTIQEVNDVATPTFQEDEVMQEEDEGESTASLETHPAPEAAEVSDVPIVTVATEQEERGGPLDEAAWPPRALERYPLAFIIHGTRDQTLQPGSLGGVSLGAGSLVSLASSSSEQPALKPITTAEEEEEIARVDALLPDLFMTSWAGSLKEGMVRCLMDTTKTYPDRPAGMYAIARNQCLSLSEGPRRRRSAENMPSAQREAKAIRLLETI